ncbi:hypothetical protein [uncultured Salinicola sp.]|uniref:hypothetical protein n=1 Tax=uncultured Salinicola sp. TaxID=1193542 RepID=UPI002633E469|nr:hypothetical protein [uncultured Salinicola sp.]|tara:strand:+ start:850 stop:1557 length:708 start_codon:yes stop_codon:yes gene_type:complete
MLHRSIIETRGDVAFPSYEGERVYMRPFLKADGLPQDLSRWQPTVDAMLEGIDTDQPVYIMIDQSPVLAGATQRRPGLHIDGYWDPGVAGHQSHFPVAAHRGGPARHRSAPRDVPYREPIHRSQQPHHASMRRGHTSHLSGGLSWQEADFSAPEGIILASSVSAARGFVGAFEGAIGDMGDCAHIDISDLAVLPMEAGRVYAGNVSCLHESLPVVTNCLRSLVRLNVPGWTPQES